MFLAWCVVPGTASLQASWEKSQGLEDPASCGGSGPEGLSPVTRGQFLQPPLSYRDFRIAEFCDSSPAQLGTCFPEARAPGSIIFHWGRSRSVPSREFNRSGSSSH